MPEPRIVAGLSCSQVLAALSDFVDGDLAPDVLAAAKAHLAGCDWCERFGGEFQDVLATFRAELGPPAPLDEDIERRLLSRLDAALDSP